MIAGLDFIISIAYVLIILIIGILFSKQRLKTGLAANYFCAGNSLKWPAIGLSLFASNISTIHLVSLAQSGFDTGLVNGAFEWMASIVLILMAVYFVPFYFKTRISTLPEFLEKRYDNHSRQWLVGVSVLSAIVIHIGFSMLAAGIVLESILGIDFYSGILVITVITALYTLIGGLRAVVVTESIQTIVLVIGAVIITIVSYQKMGGYSSLTQYLEQSNEQLKLSIFRSGEEQAGMPWYGLLLGYPVIGIWYWCADQTIVQRVLGAKNVNHARLGTLFCGFIKILPVFIFVFPGLFAFVLYQNGLLDLSSITYVEPNGAKTISTRGIYTIMIVQLLPSGLVGILVAALISALMSQISGALNSISTLVTYDWYQQRYPSANDKQLVKVGRVSGVIAIVFSLSLLPLLNHYESIFNGLNDIIAHIAPPITCVFLVGIIWSSATATSSKWTLWMGSLIGVFVFIYAKIYPESEVATIPFMLMAFYLFIISLLIQVSIVFIQSYKGYRYFHNWFSFDKNGSIDAMDQQSNHYKYVSFILLLIMVYLFWFFK